MSFSEPHGVKRTAFGDPIGVDNTPNVVVKNPKIRLYLSVLLFGLSLLSALAALLFMWFPEFANGTDLPTRWIGFTNAVISLLSGVFGVAVTVPNIPRRV